MSSDWGHTAAVAVFLGGATLFVLFVGKQAWIHRGNRIMFFSWSAVLVVFMLIYALVFQDYMNSWK